VSDARLEVLASRLDDIAEELADLAIDALRDAMRAGETARPLDERRLTQARRAVEKAAHLVRGVADSGSTLGDADA
jgi:hypothetical protein